MQLSKQVEKVLNTLMSNGLDNYRISWQRKMLWQGQSPEVLFKGTREMKF